MLFHDFAFWPFLATTLLVFYALPVRIGRHALALASFFFYAWTDWRFVFLLAFSILLDWGIGIGIAAASGKRRRWLLASGVAANLVFLGFFKYCDFFLTSVATLLGRPPADYVLGIALPVGISFFTFHGISYVVDVFRGHMQPVRSLTDFALYMGFFPHLVAGPIVRAHDFVPQIGAWRVPPYEMLQEGAQLVLLGLVKKVVFADHFAAVVQTYFDNLAGHPAAGDAWFAMSCFALQIFFDFSGYTDIARGLAQLFGFRFTLNFARPYLATNIREFWHRWHISLSTFLRDYLFIPLGGSRGSFAATCRNLMLTMLLGGLWHGASWNFVIWGGYHGALLTAHRVLERACAGTRFGRLVTSRGLWPLWWGANFVLVLIGWVFFRAKSFGDATYVLGAMVSFRGTGELFTRGLTMAAGVAFVLALLEERYALFARLVRAPAWVRVLAWCCGGLVLELFCAEGGRFPFVYFQF